MNNNLNLYDKILFPVITEKSTNLSSLNKITLFILIFAYSGFISPAIQLIMVVLPDPDGPNKQLIP